LKSLKAACTDTPTSSFAGFQVSFTAAAQQPDSKWLKAHPDFQGWMRLRVQHLQQDSSGWPPLLLKHVMKYYAANTQTGPAGTSAADTAGSVAADSGGRAAISGDSAIASSQG
jgi:hypothetical protein